jgi:hypothetical protein
MMTWGRELAGLVFPESSGKNPSASAKVIDGFSVTPAASQY